MNCEMADIQEIDIHDRLQKFYKKIDNATQ